MANFQPVNFIPKHRHAQILELPVQSLIAVRHSNQAGTNHSYIYILTSDSSSVSIDCQPNYSVPSAILPGGSKAYVVPDMVIFIHTSILIPMIGFGYSFGV
ncbi:hypothetical protein ASPFODRAFT_54953 [Aspergillus luchuensis CBS 106.47]|uniref:Uncharacterized protein n=1 Tax=Aspergillus luchuensis (strain CBS 106.47) TaxID=1137211 RepID=A0A1M3SYQ4_ASPLC|nr:hypothetical protein ASPFODRAFT_54953 [Aspergillus luchuensis CBS 106.47]